MAAPADPIAPETPAPPDRSGSAAGWLVAVALLAALAGGLRFARIGDWPFAFDEVATFQEIGSLIRPHPGPLVAQIDRLPRMIPLGELACYAGDRAFGRDEFGSRAMMAIFGTLGVVAVFALLDGPAGLERPTAVATALMVAAWPDHLFHSQNHRFYMTAWLCAGLAMLLGGRAAATRSTAWMAAAALMGLAAIASHTLQGVVLGGLAAGAVAASVAEGRRGWPIGQLAVVGVAVAVAGAAYLLYIRPLGSGWNGGGPTEGGAARSVASAVNHVGWPIVALAAAGAPILARRRPGPGAYWVALAATWLGTTAALPRLVPYAFWYNFPIQLPLFVLAGAAVGHVYHLIRPVVGPAAGAAWVAAACLLNLPSTASYYLDGSRPDYRSAARLINDRWRAGDRVIAEMTPDILPHYLRPPATAEYLTGAGPEGEVATLDAAIRRPGRLWVVVCATRSGVPLPLRDWVAAHCRREATIRRARLDHADNLVEVHLHDPAVDR